MTAMISHANVQPGLGSVKERKRVGRGNGSGKGTYSGRGVKGQGSRTGGSKFNASFEGGQTPLFRRSPKKRGFTAFAPTEYAIVNVATLADLATAGVTTIDMEVLLEKRIVRKKGLLLKVLGDGEINSAVTVVASKASKQAQEKIEKAGGKIEIK